MKIHLIGGWKLIQSNSIPFDSRPILSAFLRPNLSIVELSKWSVIPFLPEDVLLVFSISLKMNIIRKTGSSRSMPKVISSRPVPTASQLSTRFMRRIRKFIFHHFFPSRAKLLLRTIILQYEKDTSICIEMQEEVVLAQPIDQNRIIIHKKYTK